MSEAKLRRSSSCFECDHLLPIGDIALARPELLFSFLSPVECQLMEIVLMRIGTDTAVKTGEKQGSSCRASIILRPINEAIRMMTKVNR